MAGLDPASLLATWERGSGEPPLRRALILLAACTGDAVEDAAGIDTGSRDVLLAGLLARTVGARVWARTDCAHCGQPLDVPVDVAAVAGLPVHEPGTVFRTGATSFRLPTTADLATLPGCEPAQGRRILLQLCVQWPDGALPAEVADAVETAMEEVAPAGAVELTIHCGQCGETTAAALDIPALLWAEVEAQATRLVRDVHALARAYGWREVDVLALSPRRRAAYLELAGA